MEVIEGIWSDGITMWVSDSPDDKLYAYNLITKGYTPTEDFNTLAVANTAPDGLFSDGTTIWVAVYGLIGSFPIPIRNCMLTT